MKRAFIFGAVFLGVVLLGAFIAWCGGYNFDHRDSDVAAGVVFTLTAAVGFGICAVGVSESL